MDREERILIVDDDRFSARVIETQLRGIGFVNLTQAHFGQVALDLIRQNPFDIVLLDLMLPDLSGAEILNELRREERLANMPVVIVSANRAVQEAVRCIEFGAEDYLTKPLDRKMLEARVNACLEKKRLRDKVQEGYARLERELMAAADLQQSMMRLTPPPVSAEFPVEIFADMTPALEIGGDFFDLFVMPDGRLCFAVADVSGKGIPAALFMARAKSAIRHAVDLIWSAARREIEPDDTLRRVNAELCQGNGECMFVTMFLGMLTPATGDIRYCNAGHPPPILLHGPASVGGDGAKARYLDDGRGRVLGVRAASTYGMGRARLAPGDAVLIYSDGITDALEASGDCYGDARLFETVQGDAGGSAEQIARNLIDRVRGFAGDCPQFDDMTVMALRMLPPDALAASAR